MNQWTDYCTEKFRPSIRSPALLDELRDQFFTVKNLCPSTVQKLCWMNLWMNQWMDYCTEKFRSSIRPLALLDELMEWTIIQIVSIHLFVYQLYWMNGWITNVHIE